MSAFAATLLLFVSSGAALEIHERMDHHDQANAAMAAASGNGRAPADQAISPTRPLHSHSRGDCPVCDQLLHLLAVATVLLFVYGLFAAAVTFRPASVDWPVLAAVASPRSSRGPPLFA